MKKLIILSLALLALLSCSKSSEQEPTYIQLSEPLAAYFCDLSGRGQRILGENYKTELDTLYNDKEYLLNLWPYSKYEANGKEYDGYVSSVSYYIDNLKVAESSIFPFTVKYRLNLNPGTHVISCKPSIKNEYVIWEVSEGQKITVLQ